MTAKNCFERDELALAVGDSDSNSFLSNAGVSPVDHSNVRTVRDEEIEICCVPADSRFPD